MKTFNHIFLFTLLVFYSSSLQSQNVSLLSHDRNYTLSIRPLNAAISLSGNEPYSIQYYDGLGRPNQTILYRTSPDISKSIVSLTEYRDLSSVDKQWLPMALPNGTLMGKYRDTTVVKTSDDTTYNGDTKPYARSFYDNSPLNRVVRQDGPGEEWYNNGKHIEIHRYTNNSTALLFCNYFEISANGDLIKNGIYPTGALYVVKTTNEDGNDSYEFKNHKGEVVLSRTINAGETFDTYYVYDIKGNVRFILPPMASSSLTTDATYSYNDPRIANYCYRYKYDGRNRVVRKVLPGCDSLVYVYDKSDRILFSQDGVQRNENPNKWSFYHYDRLGRIVITGINITTSDARLYSDANIYCTFDPSNSKFGTGYNISTLVLNNPTILTINYYDSYQFKTPAYGFGGDYNYVAITGTAYTDTRYNSAGDNIKSKGLLTGSIVAQLEAPSNRQYSVFYYDDNDRVVYSCSSNHLGGFDRTYINYTFAGAQDYVVKDHIKSGGTSREIYDYNYDHAGRLTTIDHSYNGNPSVVIAENNYDDIGRLKSTSRQNIDALRVAYSYNVRSWTTSIKSSCGFSQEIVYNIPGSSTGYYSGNIYETKWRQTPSDVLSVYNYTYDNLSRLTSASHTRGAQTGLFNEVLSYDKNGNITALTRNSTAGVIDNLVYEYNGNLISRITDNASLPLRDTGFVYKVPENQYDPPYTYDKNGSMTKDYNRGVMIEYNQLSLPKKVSSLLTSGKYMAYTYDAAGKKLKVLTTTPGVPAKTEDYIDNKIYKDGILEKVLIPGGYITFSGSTPNYHYFVTDHLGNVRQVMSSTGIIEEKNDYYPFGLRHNRSNYQLAAGNKYKYNGKEQEQMEGLLTLDYGARLYDPALGRFHKQDRFAEKYFPLSPYQYAANNPIYYIDVNGDSLWITHNTGFLGLGGKQTLLYENGNLYNKDGSAYIGKVKGFLSKSVNALNTISGTQEGGSMVGELQSSANNFTLVKGDSKFTPSNATKAYANQIQTDPAQAGTFQALQSAGVNFAGGSGGTISWNPSGATLPTLNGSGVNGTTDLAHEMFHGLDANRGLLDNRVDLGIERSEWQAVYRENVLRSQLGSPLRTHYIKTVDANGAFLGGSGTRMLTPANQPILPNWYTP